MKKSTRAFRSLSALLLTASVALSLAPYSLAIDPAQRTQGVNNGKSTLNVELSARYNSGTVNPDGGSTEIVVYNSDNACAYAVNGTTGDLVKIDLAAGDGSSVSDMPGVTISVKDIMAASDPGFAYGDMTSVSVSTELDLIAVALQSSDYQANGRLALLSYDGEFISCYETGVQPDMVTFNENGSVALTANEGEPREGDAGTDPKGSVTVVNLSGGASSGKVSTATFDAFDSQRDSLAAAGVVLMKGSVPSTDLEPEYIAVSGATAYVSLQEASSIAVLDIASGTFTGIYPLGLQDYSATALDLLKDDSIKLETQANVYGIKMPDGISTYTSGGKTYLLTANEGDSRSDWAGMDNEVESTASPTGNVTLSSDVVWFDASLYDGLDQDKAYVFGGRSFSMYEVTSSGLELVYDSGSDFETITAAALPEYFNCSNDKISLDNRSGKKGPEPETVTTGVVDGRAYAFIALERIGGVMVYDITDPASPSYVNYINSRDFSDKIAGDVSPEGMYFVSGRNLLLTANEVSGTVCAYSLTPGEPASMPFADVSENDWFYGDAAYVYSGGLMNGTGETTFSPYLTTSRGMLVTVLYRMEKEPAVSGSCPFGDVDSGSYCEGAVTWASENGIVGGYGNGAFGPDDSITREQMASILYRYAQYKGMDVSAGANTDLSGYSDTGAVSEYALSAMQWACGSGLIQGSSGKLMPGDGALRCQTAAILHRFTASQTA